METKDDAARPWRYFIAGTAVGLAAGLLASRGRREGRPGPGLGARVLRRIPARLKVAGALGAARGVAAQAYRDARRGLARRRYI
ncbi:MAG: hypothetical protein PHF00_13285 [Elusimicrobia bacterium]|nr:hypothetical protein [Elusimicrobiota bacterium]